MYKIYRINGDIDWSMRNVFLCLRLCNFLISGSVQMKTGNINIFIYISIGFNGDRISMDNAYVRN